MELQFLNKKLQLVGIVDIATSIQWRERYREVGTFEIQIPMYDELRTILRDSFFIVHPESEYTGVIEHYDSLDSTEEGQYITVLGRFAECLLSYRISRYIRNYSNMKVSSIITNLLNENVFYPILQDDERARGLTVSPRKITSIYETVINELTTDIQVSLSTSFEDNLLEVILGLLNQVNGSIKLVLEEDKFYLVLFTGIDRREYVKFSSEFDNLISSNYVVDTTESANAIYVGGEEQDYVPGNGSKRPEGRLIWKYEEPKNGDVVSDLDRKELFVDADDVKQEIKNEHDVTTKILTEAEYKSVLYTRAKESRVYPTEEISTDIDIFTYEYGIDYNLGDLISIEDSLGLFDRQLIGIDRVTEDVTTITPIFENVPLVTSPEHYEEDSTVPSLLTESGIALASEDGIVLAAEDMSTTGSSVKISELKETTTLNNTDAIPIVNNNETKKVTYNTLKEKIINDIPALDEVDILSAIYEVENS